MTNRASKCIDCVKYWTCGKYDTPLRVLPCMVKYEFIYKKKKYMENLDMMCLKVTKCTNYMTSMRATKEDKEAKAKKLSQLYAKCGNVFSSRGRRCW